MKKNKLAAFIILLVFCFSAFPLRCVYAADTKVDFSITRNVATFKRDKSGKNIAQFPAITINNIANPEKVTGYSAVYVRTHGGDGARLKKSDAQTTQPALAGTYSVIISFTDDVPFVCKNGTKTQEYPAAFIIKRAEQTPPVLRSATPTLTDNADRTGGTIAEGNQAIISVAWSSGLKPILTWTAGSDAVITPEAGKPARFTSKAAGTAVITALLPEDNNYLASKISVYTVTVTGSTVSSAFYSLSGQTKNQSGWYTSDIMVIGKNGFTKVVAEGAHPVSADGEQTLKFALENESGGKTETFSVKVKKDSTAPSADNLRINDSPWMDIPDDYEAAWASDADLIVTADIYDGASGIAKVEYRIDGGDYVNDENIAFKTEGCKSHEFSYTIENTTINTDHILWLRLTDTAGNTAVVDYLIPAGKSEEDTPDSESSSTSNEPESEITEPTLAMKEVLERLAYLYRCNIEAQVNGDVRANSAYITQTLEMFTALSSAERKALGEDALAGLRAYFEKLYEIEGKDKAELEPLFIFAKEKPPVSSSDSESESISQSQSIPSQSESMSEPQSVSSAPESVSSASSSVPAAAPANGNFPFVYLIPLAAVIIALCVYFVWRKRTVQPKSKFELPLQSKEEDFNNFGGFNDPDE